MELHPEFLKKNGKNQFVVLPYEEFLAIQKRLIDAEDLIELRLAKEEEADAPTVSLAEMKKRFGMNS